MVAVVAPIAVNRVLTDFAEGSMRSFHWNRDNMPLEKTGIAGSKSCVVALDYMPRNPVVAFCCD